MKRYLVVSLFLYAVILQAGEHSVTRDDFTGEKSNKFVVTAHEAKIIKAIYIIGDYEPSNNTVSILITPLLGSADCNNRQLVFKDINGKIKKVNATQLRYDACFVPHLDADIVKKPFKVRIPIDGGDDYIIDVDTTSLNLLKLQ